MLSDFLGRKKCQLLVIPLIIVPVILVLVYFSVKQESYTCSKFAKQTISTSKEVENMVGGAFELSAFPDIIERNDSVYYRVRVSGPVISKDILCIISFTQENDCKLVSVEEDNGRFRRKNANQKWLIKYK